MIPQSVLQAFGFSASCTIQSIGSGHIHKTLRVEESKKSFILQCVNHFVFNEPEVISRNIQHAGGYLNKHYPEYLFLSMLKTTKGFDMAVDEEGYSWRAFPFIENTKTFDEVSKPEQAFEAAKGFARLTKNLSGCDPSVFTPTIDRFHDLGWRYEQFEASLKNALVDRLDQAQIEIATCNHFFFLVDQYKNLISSGNLILRITHNDTKINNILFDNNTGKAVCVIDLDTLMPGFFIYDLGDMVRTFVSPVSEEETDLTEVVFREEMYTALLDGYLQEMGGFLSVKEKLAIPFAGPMMTYIMALRFLADFLIGDVYYTTSYKGQNLNRAKNQLKLLEVLLKNIK
ncbi:MAG: aminoglycoside phosphotransferase family protein [Cyclobacteriaceae bacterium]|nr:aminoglycoside phosphotransferase family protein [Cyclobacteriaceae bacterium]